MPPPPTNDGGKGIKLPTHPKPTHKFLATRRAEAAAAAAAAQRGPDMGGTGIALSGGGNRAYTCAFGVLRGLAVKGALDNPLEKQWMSGASGGGWATATYSFNQSVPRDVLLDVGRAALSPSELTVEACSTIEPRSMGQPVSTKPMTYWSMLLSIPRSCIASSLSLQPFGAISWIRNIWRVYLAPFGVPQGKLFAASAAEVDAKGGRRDDYLFPAKYCASTPLIGITMYGPSVAQLGPIPGCTLPGCVGMRRVKHFVGNINAADVAAATIDGPSPEEARAKHDNHAPVQYVVSPSEVATGYSGPLAEVSGLACISETIDIGHVPGVHPSEWSQGFGKANSLEFYLGAGSMMEAASLSSKQFSLMGRIENAALEALMPTARFETNVGVWNTLKLGDGGNLDNTASLTLLRRQCKEVLVLMSSGRPFYSKSSNKEHEDKAKQKRPPPSQMTRNEYDAAALGADLSSLFGVPLIAADGSWNYQSPGFNHQTNQVFAIERYHELCEKFESALASGAPLVARLENVEVHANTFHGVTPYTCNYTVIWNHAPRQWLEKVPPATLEAVLNGDVDSVNTPGSFPNFATIRQNKGLMEFTPLQTNLLADMMAWIVHAEWDKLKPCFS